MAEPKPRRARAKGARAAAPRLSRQRRPESMAPADWQRALRRQYGREQGFELENLGGEPVFSEFRVTNPAQASRYRVAIRGIEAGLNRCTCADYASNDLGTCKHIEFTLGRLLKKRGAKAAFARGFRPPYSEIVLQTAGERAVRWLAGTTCPPAVARRAAALFGSGGLLPRERAAELDGFIAALRRQKGSHELRVDDAALAFVAQLRDAERRRSIVDAAYPAGAADPGLAGLLKAPLYHYQAKGALFAARAGRALIADEMGLGKTVQAIAAAELMARHFGVGRVLVVCPTSLKHQWQREFERFAGRAAQVGGGLRAERARRWRDDAYCKIVNYDVLAADLEPIAAWAPELLIVDEAQRVKNWETIAARALRRIDTPYAIVLTGTPLENRLEELIAIVQLVDPHRLGPTWRLRHEHHLVDDHGRVVGYRDLDRLGCTLAPVLLRRRKAEVLDELPERVDKNVYVALTPEQRAHHDENGLVVTRIVARWRKTGFLADADQRRLQCALQNMRMACNSTWLLDRETDHGSKADELMTLLEELFEDPAAKAVVFSQWIGTHELVERRLATRGWAHVRFHGGVPAEQRGALVERFHADPACRLFLSTDAGGVGLNLQHAAATVFNMDLPWNPAVLEQRIGRVYRLGQRRGVRVVNLVAERSIEEGMLSVLAFKTQLFAGVLDGGDAEVLMQGTRLARFIETVDEVTRAAPAAEPPPRSAPHAAEPGADASAAPAPTEPPAAAAPAVGPADPWSPLLEAGLELARRLASADGPWAHTDPETGRRELRIPLPEPEAVRRLADGLASLLEGLRPR